MKSLYVVLALFSSVVAQAAAVPVLHIEPATTDYRGFRSLTEKCTALGGELVSKTKGALQPYHENPVAFGGICRIGGSDNSDSSSTLVPVVLVVESWQDFKGPAYLQEACENLGGKLGALVSEDYRNHETNETTRSFAGLCKIPNSSN